jgi:two-component SAPR family response regulator
LLPKTLFYYLVDRGITTRADIFERFWPNLPSKEATNVFHVTKRKINELLKADLMIYERSFYRIAPEIHLRYDVSLFHQYIQDSAGVAGAAKRDLLLRAISLYRAAFIHSLDSEWARSRRDEMAEAYADALSSLAEVYEGEGNAEEAFVNYLRAFQQRPHSAEIVAPILRLGSEQQRQDEARGIYHQYLTLLDGGAPKSELAALYDALF